MILYKLKGITAWVKRACYVFLLVLAQPLEGEVRWDAEAVSKQREQYHQNLLYLGHLLGVKPELTAWENLQFINELVKLNKTPICCGICEKVGY